MSIRILFADGSNQYVKYNMSLNEFTDELEKWQQDYILQPTSVFGLIYNYKAYRKEVM